MAVWVQLNNMAPRVIFLFVVLFYGSFLCEATAKKTPKNITSVINMSISSNKLLSASLICKTSK